MAVAIYARVSTTKQADKDLSIPDQLRQLRDWCKRNGHEIAKEYVEPGASATDDKRPEFQQMIADATLKPSPYEVIVVHSLSRFFRDMIEFALYERRLNKFGCKVVSITQITSDDSAGQMARQIFSMFVPPGASRGRPTLLLRTTRKAVPKRHLWRNLAGLDRGPQGGPQGLHTKLKTS